MAVHPFFSDRFDLIRDVASWDEADDNQEKGRRLAEFGDPGEWTQPPGVQWQHQEIAGPHGPVPLRVYTPDVDASTRGGLVWMHGGAFVGGALDWPEAHGVSAELARRAGVVVVSVDYRLAVGGTRYPVPLDDVVTAWSWVNDQRRQLGLDGRIAIGGASAGANLAAGATRRIGRLGGPAPSALLLAYPVLHFPVPPISPSLQHEMRDVPRLLRFLQTDHVSTIRNYVGHVHNVPLEATPGNGDLTGTPPTAIVISEYDDLRSSAELFIDQLQEAGAPVTSHLAEGMLHGHLNRYAGDHLPEVGRSLDFLAAALQAA